MLIKFSRENETPEILGRFQQKKSKNQNLVDFGRKLIQWSK